jgi:hypothetical protein
MENVLPGLKPRVPRDRFASMQGSAEARENLPS